MKTRAIVVIALFSFVLVALVVLARRPFTRACAGELEVYECPIRGPGPPEASLTLNPGPGAPGKLMRYPLGSKFEVHSFSYGHDPPRWYADLYLKDACRGQDQIGLGLISGGTIEIRRSLKPNSFDVVGNEWDGHSAFALTVTEPKPTREYVPRAAGALLGISVIVGLIALAVGRRMRTLRDVLRWPEGVVREDGTLEPVEGGAPIPLGCACREKPGKRILFVARKGAAVGPYREHGRGGIADHVEFSRDEGTRHATRLAIIGLAIGLLASGLAVVAFFLAGS